LKQAAIKQDPRLFCLDDVTRTGYFAASCANESDFHLDDYLVILSRLKQARLLDLRLTKALHLPILRLQAHQFDPVIGFRVSRRGTGNEHPPFGGDFVFAQPARNPFAPVSRFFGGTDVPATGMLIVRLLNGDFSLFSPAIPVLPA
jgi:hypothetical protein